MATEHMKRAPCHSGNEVNWGIKSPGYTIVQLSDWQNPNSDHSFTMLDCEETGTP